MDLQNSPKDPNTTEKKRPERRGFYLALAICLFAIGVAAWSTYDTVSNFLSPEETGASAKVSATARPAATRRPSATAAPKDADPEANVSAGHGAATGPVVTITPETTAAPEVPVQTVPETEPDAEPAAAQPLYEESDGFTRPVRGDVLSAFSDVPVYSETMRDFRAHMGVDLAAEHGETVHAAANGVVKETKTDLLLGNVIVIEHGAYEVSYCGLGETFLVEPGEVVAAGQDIGSVTAAPYESAMEPHLHMEVRRDGEPIDPASLFL